MLNLGWFKMFSSFVILSLAISGSVGAAQPAGDAAATPTAKPVKERKICRESDDSTSRMAKRICRTAKEWSEAGENSKAGARRARPED